MTNRHTLFVYDDTISLNSNLIPSIMQWSWSTYNLLHSREASTCPPSYFYFVWLKLKYKIHDCKNNEYIFEKVFKILCPTTFF